MKFDKVAALATLNQFTTEVNSTHPNTATANFLLEMNQQLQNAEGVAVTGTMQTIINRVPLVKMEDDLVFTDTEAKLWQQLSSFNQLGSNLFTL